MLDLPTGVGYWADITLGDLCRYSADPAVWTKIAVLVLAVGATRFYFGQSLPTAIPFQWPAPEVSLILQDQAYKAGSRARVGRSSHRRPGLDSSRTR